MTEETTSAQPTADELKAELGEMQGEYNEADAADPNRIPDGRYQMQCIDATVRKAKESGRLMLSTQWRVYGGGKAIGRKVWRNSGLNPKGFPYLKKDLAVCKIAVTQLPELVDRASELVGCKVQMTATTKGEFQNYYIDRFLGKGAVEDPDQEFDPSKFGSDGEQKASEASADDFLDADDEDANLGF